MRFADLSVARRLEAAEAQNAIACAEAEMRLRPETGATCQPVADGFAVFVGPTSPLTHALGIGLSGPVAPADLDAMELFFRRRHAPSTIELCPLADASLTCLLGRRAYRPVEFNNVLVRPIERDELLPLPRSDSIRIEMTPPADADSWTRAMAEGFFEGGEVSTEECALGATIFHASTPLQALVDGRRAGGAAMSVRSGLACLFADSTLREFRGRGVHKALIHARLRRALAAGCDMATASTLPGSISQRNYEQLGFRIVYTKIIMSRAWS